MANKVMDGGLGTFAYYGTLPGVGSSLAIVLLTTVESDTLLQSRLLLSTVLANNTESTASGYARIFVTASVTVSIASHVTTLSMPSQSWTAVASAPQINKLLVCYKPSAGAADNAIIPLAEYDFVIVPDGSNITATVSGTGLATATAV